MKRILLICICLFIPLTSVSSGEVVSEWQKFESLGDNAVKSGNHKSAFDYFTYASFLSLVELVIAGKNHDAFTSILILEIDSVSACHSEDKSEICDITSIEQGAATKALCEKTIAEWEVEIAQTKHISVLQKIPCLPYGKRTDA